MVLHDTGCRISEALALSPEQIDFNAQAIIFETLKKRRRGIFRAVPVPPESLDTLNMVHGLQEALKSHKRGLRERPLWSWSRMTGWRKVRAVMKEAGIAGGPHRAPKGLRHGFGVHAVGSGVPLNMLSKWMGHASLEVTAIYANATGKEERNIAERMWG